MSADEVLRTLDAVRECEAWAVIRRKAEPTAGVVGGRRSVVESILDIPLESGAPEPGRSVDRLAAVPFRQVRERGFEAVDDDTPLVVVDIDLETEVAVPDLVAALPDVPIELADGADRGGFATSDEEYGDVVGRIIRDEIGQGEGANLVIGRPFRATLKGWDAERALSVFRRLLERERGAYWTFVLFTGDRYLIGASPERHVSVRGLGDVRMNPISGTFRLPRGTTVDDSIDGVVDIRPGLMEFLRDEKEIYELFMVVDEELKMMCDICSEGGTVLGPFLKPMTHLVHTEYLLAGRTDRDTREVLRDTMYAATVTGSPVENACRLIAEYEPEGRGYYGAALALFGRGPDGSPTMDSPILIRSADVSPEGQLKVTAGATLVRDSDPAYEVAETHAKAGGILSAFGLAEAARPLPDGALLALTRDEDVQLALAERNRRLSRFWLADQAATPVDPALQGKRVLILDGEDDFVNMLRHVLGHLGMTSEVVRHEDIDDTVLASLGRTHGSDTGPGGHDLVIVGPGPGDPRADDDPKMQHLRAAVSTLLEGEVPFLAVCLGHQALCHQLGIPLHYKDIVFQGTQADVVLTDVDPDGVTRRVGFYNTFVGRVGDTGLPDGVRVDADPESGDIHALHGPHYAGVQFHAESVLTEQGYDIIHDLVGRLLGDR